MHNRNILLYSIFAFTLSISEFIASDIPSTIIDKLKTAEQSYKQKNYSQAITLYQSVLNNHYESFEIYYNLANAYYKNNQLGKAILYYEKAKKMNPSDNDLNHNLKIAYNHTIDKIETKDNFFIEVTKNSFLNKINTNFIVYINIAISIITLLLFIFFLYQPNVRKITLTTIIILMILNIIIYFMGKSAQNIHVENNFAIVTQKEVRVSNEPIPNAVSKFTLHEGTKVKILQKVDTFYLIRLENGIEGWINENSIEVI